MSKIIKNNFVFFVILVYIYFLIILDIINAVRPPNPRDRPITYPTIDDFPTECILDDGSKGICRNIRYCPTAITAKKPSKTCYFEGFEQFVCCKDSVLDEIKEGPATKECRSIPNRYSIAHGITTKPWEFPYMVALGWETQQPNIYEYKCGGTLIEKKFVITAAHCALLNGLEPGAVLVGGANLNDTNAKVVKISKIIIHPDYKSNLAYHDIAIIKLHEIIDVYFACIWTNYAFEYDNVTVIGYGHTVFAGIFSNVLLKGFVSVTPNNECDSHYGSESAFPQGIIDGQMCARDPTNYRDTCQGDSGGPAVLKMPATENKGAIDYIVGVTSFGYGCALGVPGVYTRISEYVDWIEGIVWENYSEKSQ